MCACLLKPDNNVETINIFLAPPEHTNPLSHACDIREESGEEKRGEESTATTRNGMQMEKKTEDHRTDRKGEEIARGTMGRGSGIIVKCVGVARKNRNITKQTAIY